ncbi:hypothetical protein JAAARDRAFT_33424 [Jaapia argillacea MUCL 33604]|uniref:G domain-containing protein n=1 Tax=Jaapia argillacea MUCL 33604 TaxID=933084 RepID=A0A067Q8L7_9AGAM|nr:hypothetical protein JAAARDRAFT_33424 [Jaapia argillacea MUCL 33604]
MDCQSSPTKSPPDANDGINQNGPSSDGSRTANVIIFGESGVGKSSIVNMIAGRDVAGTSSSLLGCTFEAQAYDVTPDPLPHTSPVALRLFDTAGLNEGSAGTVASPNAIANLYTLLRNMDGGINLLVFVVRGPRIKQSTFINYDIFYKAFCQEKVPIVLIVTGLEQEDSIPDWWHDNQEAFDKYKMIFKDVACIVSTRGRRIGDQYMFQQEYDDSRSKVEQLILRNCTGEPWKMDRITWFTAILMSLYNHFTPILPGIKPAALAHSLYYGLRDGAGMAPHMAKIFANLTEVGLLFEELPYRPGIVFKTLAGRVLASKEEPATRRPSDPGRESSPESTGAIVSNSVPPHERSLQSQSSMFSFDESKGECKLPPRTQFIISSSDQSTKFFEWSKRYSQTCLTEMDWYIEPSAARHEYLILKFELHNLSFWLRLERNAMLWSSIIMRRKGCCDRVQVRDRLSELIALGSDRRIASIRVNKQSPVNLPFVGSLQHHLTGKAHLYHALTANCFWYTGVVWESIAGCLGNDAIFSTPPSEREVQIGSQSDGASLSPTMIFSRDRLRAHVTVARRAMPTWKGDGGLEKVVKASEEVLGFARKYRLSSDDDGDGVQLLTAQSNISEVLIQGTVDSY